LSGFGSVTNSEDTVIEGSSASGSDDTTGVGLESGLIGFDGNGDWSLGKSSLHLWEGLGNIGEIGNLTDTLGGVIFALVPEVVSSSVWVLSLGHEWGGFDVLESVVHKTTIASTVLGGAVNELLLGVGGEGSGGDLLGTFDGSGGGESPA